MKIDKPRLALTTNNVVTSLLATIMLLIFIKQSKMGEMWVMLKNMNTLETGKQISFADYAADVLVGLVLIFTGLFGVVTAQLAFVNLLIAYQMVIGCALFEQIVRYIFVLSFLFTQDETTKKALKRLIKMYENETITWYTEYMDVIQHELNCCGIEMYYDWTYELGRIPSSCCEKPVNRTCEVMQVSQKSGCVYRVSDAFQLHTQIIIIISSAITVTLIISLVISSRLKKQVGGEEHNQETLPSAEVPETDRNLATAESQETATVVQLLELPPEQEVALARDEINKRDNGNPDIGESKSVYENKK